MVQAVGIDDLNLYPSTLAVEAPDIASARGTPDRDLRRLKLVRRSLAPGWEDPVTLAVNAAKPLVDAAGADTFELLLVATESGVDYGKPLSSYVHEHLGLGTRCRNAELKHACYAGTAALQLAAAWARSSEPGKRALVVMTDMARKIFGDPAEPAEGAGAVALVVAANPRVLTLEEHSGYAAREVYDVTRPTPTLERANAGLSLGAYLDLLEATCAQYRERVGPGVSLERHFDRMIYHTPLVPLVEQAHRLFVESGREDATADEVAASFERMVRGSLRFCQEVGNLYGGSLYAALAGLLDGESLAPGARVGLYSYGSGSCAELFSGLVGARAREIVAARRIGERLAARRRATFAEYEAVVIENERALTAADFVPDRDAPAGLHDELYRGRGLLVLDRVRDYYRSYAWS